jgi:phospholipid-binding lipoprotein MlaA
MPIPIQHKTNALFLFVSILVVSYLLTGCAHQSSKNLYASLDPIVGLEQENSYITDQEKTTRFYVAEAETTDDEFADDEFADDEFADDEFADDDLDFLDEEDEGLVIDVADPLAPINKVMYHFNDKLYFWVLKPVARGYKFVMPSEIRGCAKNFFYNLGAPIRFTNCLLQGKGRAAGAEFGRFFINSTVGFLGLGDVADRYPALKSHQEDLGQTLATYGIGNGIFIMWPFLGPSTLRDSVGLFGDSFLYPVRYYVQPWEAVVALEAYDSLNTVSFHIGDYEALKEMAIDPYEAFQDGYLQNRLKKINE